MALPDDAPDGVIIQYAPPPGAESFTGDPTLNHAARVLWIEYDDSGRRLLTLGGDATVRVWPQGPDLLATLDADARSVVRDAVLAGITVANGQATGRVDADSEPVIDLLDRLIAVGDALEAPVDRVPMRLAKNVETERLEAVRVRNLAALLTGSPAAVLRIRLDAAELAPLLGQCPSDLAAPALERLGASGHAGRLSLLDPQAGRLSTPTAGAGDLELVDEEPVET